MPNLLKGLPLKQSGPILDDKLHFESIFLTRMMRRGAREPCQPSKYQNDEWVNGGQGGVNRIGCYPFLILVAMRWKLFHFTVNKLRPYYGSLTQPWICLIPIEICRWRVQHELQYPPDCSLLVPLVLILEHSGKAAILPTSPQ